MKAKDIEKYLSKGSKLIYKNTSSGDMFFIDSETIENRITKKQFDKYISICNNEDLSERFPNWLNNKPYRCYYWL